MTTCWHCATHPGDPHAAQKVKVHRGTMECEVTIPTCSQCGRVIHRADNLLEGFVLVGVAAGVVLGVAVANWLIAIPVFLGAWALGGLVAYAIKRAKGIKVNSYPELKRLRAERWKIGAAPKPRTMTGARKTCSRCGRGVPQSARRGESCPHCGAYWSFEHEERSTRTR